MDFQPSEEFSETGELVCGVLEKVTPERMSEAEADGFDATLWSDLARAGVLGLTIPEEFGGTGLDWECALAALIEHGRRPAPVPVWETLVLGVLPLQRFAPQAGGRWLSGVAAGDTVLTAGWADQVDGRLDSRATGGEDGWLLNGRCGTVPAGDRADAVLIPALIEPESRLGLFLCPGETLRRTPLRLSHRGDAADLRFDDCPAELITADAGALDWCRDLAWLGLAALQVGLSAESVRHTAEHVTERHQFGVALGTFQAVAHQLADAAIASEAMRLTLTEAIWRLASGLPEAGTVQVARWWATEHGPRIARCCQHLHGGSGADATSAISRYFLWSLTLAHLFGSSDRHTELLAGALRDGSAHDPGRVETAPVSAREKESHR